MNNAELDKVLASMDAAVRRAYALGRKEALDQLVTYCRSDEVASPPLALAPPELGSAGLAEHAPADAPGLESPPTANDDVEGERPRVDLGRNGSGGITGAILDFVYPPKAR
jgi:hypothetical protein